MPTLLSAQNLAKEYSGRILFEKISLGIESGDRIGLIGPNGAGKSTLLKILAKLDEADTGSVARGNGLKVAYLDQVPLFDPGATIMETLLKVMDPRLEDWEHQVKAIEVLSQLDLENAGLEPETLVDSLSGGWKKKVAIAREWARDPDLFFMDEPTNHLDVESILWLEDLLKQANYAYVVITHDRQFLQNVCDKILELDRRNPGGLLTVKGTFADYLEIKEQTIASQEQKEESMKNTLRREVEWLRRGAKARTTKQQARIQRAETLKQDVAVLETRNRSIDVSLGFQSIEGGPKKLIEAVGISKKFGQKILFKDFSYSLMKGTRLGLIGPNGCGKSTFIKTLLGELPPDQGVVKQAEHIQVAYFEQNRDSLKPEESLLKNICPQGDHVKYRGNWIHIRGYLDRMGFDTRQAELPIKKLSGGEQARILIAQLMLKEANILVLDEPTNDLDVATLDLLQNELCTFDGALILVSHDRYFLDQVSTNLLAFNSFDPGTMEAFSELSQWESWYLQMRDQQQVPTKKEPIKAVAEKIIEAPVSTPKKSQQKIEADIKKAENQMKELVALTDSLKDPIKIGEHYKKISDLQQTLDQLYEQWGS